jgi:altronate dehydratase
MLISSPKELQTMAIHQRANGAVVVKRETTVTSAVVVVATLIAAVRELWRERCAATANTHCGFVC